MYRGGGGGWAFVHLPLMQTALDAEHPQIQTPPPILFMWTVMQAGKPPHCEQNDTQA